MQGVMQGVDGRNPHGWNVFPNVDRDDWSADQVSSLEDQALARSNLLRHSFC